MLTIALKAERLDFHKSHELYFVLILISLDCFVIIQELISRLKIEAQRKVEMSAGLYPLDGSGSGSPLFTDDSDFNPGGNKTSSHESPEECGGLECELESFDADLCCQECGKEYKQVSKIGATVYLLFTSSSFMVFFSLEFFSASIPFVRSA